MNKARGALAGMLAPVLAALPLGGCIVPAGIEETVIPARVDYNCARGRVLQVLRSPDTLYAKVMDDGKEVLLRRLDSAAQEKYGDGRYILYLDGERAMLELNGQVLYGPCVSAVPLPWTMNYR